MPLYTTLAALSQTAASNPPDGTVDAPSTIDDQLRLLGSFIAQLRDGSGFTSSFGNVLAAAPTGSQLATARGILGTSGQSAVRGLVGAVNAGTPLTKYDLQALAVVLRDANGALVTQLNTATITCDLGLAGSSANGRDQAAAFTANSWIYLYFIWNGATLATLASTTTPASFTGSTLPTGYTHWAFATALRWNASSNIIPAFTQGANVFYDIADAGVNRVVSSGVVTVMTAVGCGSLIPPGVALFGKFNFTLAPTNASIATFTLNVRKTGSSIAGIGVVQAAVQVAGQQGIGVNALDFPLNASAQIDYKLSAAPTSGGAFIDVLGFTIPNGDA